MADITEASAAAAAAAAFVCLTYIQANISSLPHIYVCKGGCCDEYIHW